MCFFEKVSFFIIIFKEMKMFEVLNELKSDSVLGLIKLYAMDKNHKKIDLGVGVYKDKTGITPVMSSVKESERYLLYTQKSKSYYGSDGNPEFISAVSSLLFGKDYALQGRLNGCQTVGGTGALQMAAALAAKCSSKPAIWIGMPTWPNHAQIFSSAGLEILTYEYFDPKTQTIQFDTMMSSLEKAKVGDLVLLHACCHNPSGADLTLSQWVDLSKLIKRKQLIPLIDCAYLGLGNNLEDDCVGLRLMVREIPEALVAFSCSKNFGLYRERTGVLFVSSKSSSVIPIKSHLQQLARVVYSTPPDHGAAVVTRILTDEKLYAMWREELDYSTQRMLSIRALLGKLGKVENIDFNKISMQRGMFSLLPLSESNILKLRESFGIYMPMSGRINIAGLNDNNIDYFFSSICSVLK